MTPSAASLAVVWLQIMEELLRLLNVYIVKTADTICYLLLPPSQPTFCAVPLVSYIPFITYYLAPSTYYVLHPIYYALPTTY